MFLRLVLQQTAGRTLSADQHDALRAAVIGRWARVLHVCIALILLTGGYNLYIMIGRHPGQPLYHALLGIKILLALTLFFLAIAITGRNLAFAKLRQNRAAWLLVNIALAGVIVLISNVLKSIPTGP